MDLTNDASRWQLVPLLFSQAAVAASQTDAQLATLEAGTAVQAVQGYVMPWEWEVLAVSAQLSAAGSAGSLTVGATVGGTEDADTTLTITTETSKYKAVLRGSICGPAGSVIGAEITTAAGWNGTTADLVVIVWALVRLDGV